MSNAIERLRGLIENLQDMSGWSVIDESDVSAALAEAWWQGIKAASPDADPEDWDGYNPFEEES